MHLHTFLGHRDVIPGPLVQHWLDPVSERESPCMRSIWHDGLDLPTTQSWYLHGWPPAVHLRWVSCSATTHEREESPCQDWQVLPAWASETRITWA